jgi:t-SNARE complex subunit (syntaxin)
VVGAEAATDQATHQLAKAEESQKSGSNIACLILVIIVVVLLILVITLKVI